MVAVAPWTLAHFPRGRLLEVIPGYEPVSAVPRRGFQSFSQPKAPERQDQDFFFLPIQSQPSRLQSFHNSNDHELVARFTVPLPPFPKSFFPFLPPN